MGTALQGRNGRGLIGRAQRADGILGTATIQGHLGRWALVALVALVLPSCQGGGVKPGAPVESTRSSLILPPEPVQDTPLSALATSVKSANQSLTNLIVLLSYGAGIDEAAAEAALAAVKLTNTAAKTVDQNDFIEMDQTSAKTIESSASAAHVAAAALVQMAAKAMTYTGEEINVAEMGAAVSGANSAAIMIADAAGKLAATGDICNSKQGHKENMNQASASMESAKSASDGLAWAATAMAELVSGDLADKLNNLAAKAADNSATAVALINALDAAKLALDGSDPGAALEAVATAVNNQKAKAGSLSDASVEVAKTSEPDNNTETLTKLSKTGTGNVAATAMNAEQDTLKKLASAVAAGHIAGAAMSAMANKEMRASMGADLLAAIAEEVNQTAAIVANDAAKAMESSSSMGASASSQKETEAAVTATHVMAAALAEAAAEEMSADEAEWDSYAVPELATMMAAARNAQGRLVEAVAKALAGKAPARDLGELVTMVGTAAAAANTQAEQIGQLAEQAASEEEDSGLVEKLQQLQQRAEDKQSGLMVGKTSADSAQKLSTQGADPSNEISAMDNAAKSDKTKVRGIAEGAQDVSAKAYDGGSTAESLAKTTKAGASEAVDACAGAAHQGLKEMASSLAAAQTVSITMSSAASRFARMRSADSQEKMANVSAEANKASAHLANSAYKTMEGARESELDSEKSRQMENMASSAQVAATGMEGAAVKAMDPAPNTYHERAVDLGAMIAGQRVASNTMAQAISEFLGSSASLSAGVLSQMISVATAATNGTAYRVQDMVARLVATCADATKRQALEAMSDALTDDQTARTMAGASADVAVVYSDSQAEMGNQPNLLQQAASDDRPKARGTANAVSGGAETLAPSSSGESVAMTASAGTGNAAPACAGASQQALTKLAASMAASHTVAASLAAAAGRAEKLKTMESIAKLAAAKAEAHKAAAQLSNSAETSMESISELGNDREGKQQIDATNVAAHTAAAGMANAASRSPTDMKATCGDTAPAADLAAMAGAMRVASNRLAQAVATTMMQEAPSDEGGKLVQMTTVATVGANDATESVGRTAGNMAEKSQDPSKTEALQGIKQGADDKQTSRDLGKKSAETSKEFAMQDGDTSKTTQMQTSAQADQSKAKNMADQAGGSAEVLAPGGLGESLAKTASAAGDVAPTVCANASLDAMKRMASSMAAASNAAANLAAASQKAQKVNTAASRAKLASAKAEANLAAAKLGNAAGKAMDSVSEMGAAVSAKSAIESAVAMAHATAASMAEAASAVEGSVAMADAPVAELGAMMGSLRAAVNGMAQATSEQLDGVEASSDAGQLGQMTAASSAAATTTQDEVGKTAGALAEKTPDSGKAESLNELRQKAEQQDTAKDVTMKASETSQQYSSTSLGTSGSTDRLRQSASADQITNKSMSDQAANTAGVMRPNSNAEAIAKTSAAGSINAPATCGGGAQEILKKLASAMAAAVTSGATLAGAMKDAEQKKSPENMNKVSTMKGEAHKAAAQLANSAAKTMEVAGSLGLSPAVQTQMEATVAAAHTAAAGLEHAASAWKSEDSKMCGTPGNAIDLGASLASVRSASNSLAQTVAQVSSKMGASLGARQLMQMAAATAAAANTKADHVATTASVEMAADPNGQKVAPLTNLRNSAQDKSTSVNLAEKSGVAAQKFANGENPEGAANTMKNAASNDRTNTKSMADTTTNSANSIAPGGNAETVSKMASAGATNASVACSSASANAMKKMVSALAAAQTASAALNAASKKVLTSRTAESMAKMTAVAAEANKAASHLANSTAKTMEQAGALGLGSAQISAVEKALMAAHTVAAGLAQTASQVQTGNAATCVPPAVADLSAQLAAGRMASDVVAQMTAQTSSKMGASMSSGQVAQMTAATVATTNTAANEMADMAGKMAQASSDAQMQAALNGMKASASDNSSAQMVGTKAGDSAKASSGSGANTASSAAAMDSAAANDKQKAKTISDSATNVAQKQDPGSNAESVSKLSKANAAELPAASYPSASQEMLKKMASAVAAANTSLAALAKASNESVKSGSASSQAMKESAVKDANQAAGQLAGVAAKTMEDASAMGLPAGQLAQVESTVAAAHNLAAALAQAAAQTASGDVACGGSHAVSEMGAAMASGRAAATNLSQSTAQILTGVSGSLNAGMLASLNAAAAVAANAAVDRVGVMAGTVATKSADPSLAGLLNAVKAAAQNKANALVMALKGAEAAQAFANGTGSAAGAASSLGSAAMNEKSNDKMTADSVAATANYSEAGGITETVARLASASSTGEAVSGTAATAAQTAEKKLASGMAAAQIASAVLAVAAEKAEKLKSAESMAKLASAINEAQATAMQAANTTTKTMEGATGLGLTAGQAAQLENAVTAMHAATSGLASAGAQHATGESVACGNPAKVVDLGAMVAAVRNAANSMAQSSGQIAGTSVSQASSRLTQMVGAAAAASNTAAEKIGSVANKMAQETAETSKKASLTALAQAMAEKTTALSMASKVAEAAKAYASGSSNVGSVASDVRASATADKMKAKSTADVASSSAGVLASGSNAESIAKLSSAAGTGDPAWGAVASAAETAVKKLASAAAAANTALAGLGAGIAAAASSTTVENLAKLVTGVRAAATAGTQLRNSATQVSNMAGSLGLSASVLAQLKATLASAQAAANAQTASAAQASQAMAGSCSSATALSGVEGAVAASNGLAGSLAGTVGQMLTGQSSSAGRARLVGIMGAVSASANSATKSLIDAVQTVMANTTDARTLANLAALLVAANNNASALNLTNKAATVAQTLASGGSPAGALADLAAAVNAAGTFIGNLGAAAGAAAASTLTAQIAQLADPNLWTISNGVSSRSPISSNGFGSVSVAANGYTPLVSAPMSSAEIRALAGASPTKMSYALWIPTTAPNPYWVGGTQMYISSTSANIVNAYMGQVELTGLPVQTFFRPTFTVPASAMPILNGNYNDVIVTVVINANAGTQGWLLNDLHFGS